MTYEEMVLCYETVERSVGISGEPLGLMQFRDRVMQPPMGMTCGEKHFQAGVDARFGHAPQGLPVSGIPHATLASGEPPSRLFPEIVAARRFL